MAASRDGFKLTDGLGSIATTWCRCGGCCRTRFAVDAYGALRTGKTLLEAIASSLTELFSPEIISERLDGIARELRLREPRHARLFRQASPAGRRDSDFALAYVKRHARTPQMQQAVFGALEFKCDVLWAMLDALHYAYVAPKHFPPMPSCPTSEGGRMSDQLFGHRSEALRACRTACAWSRAKPTAAGVLLAPERLFKADAIAMQIIKTRTGAATLADIVDDLCENLRGPARAVLADTTTLLRGLADKSSWSSGRDGCGRRGIAAAARPVGGIDPPLSAGMSLLLQPAGARAREDELDAATGVASFAKRPRSASCRPTFRAENPARGRPRRDHGSRATMPGLLHQSHHLRHRG